MIEGSKMAEMSPVTETTPLLEFLKKLPTPVNWPDARLAVPSKAGAAASRWSPDVVRSEIFPSVRRVYVCFFGDPLSWNLQVSAWSRLLLPAATLL